MRLFIENYLLLIKNWYEYENVDFEDPDTLYLVHYSMNSGVRSAFYIEHASSNQESLVNHKPLSEVEDVSVNEESRMKDCVCSVCLQNLKQVIFSPCNHMATCGSCTIRLEKCPLCKVKINKSERVFYDGKVSTNHSPFLELEDVPVNEESKMKDCACTVCGEKLKQILLEPCNHMTTCNACSTPLVNCPLCETYIVNKLRVFY